MPDAIDQLADAARSDLAAANDAAALEAFRIQYLGSKGSIKALTKQIGQQPQEERKAFGQRVNALSKEIEQAFADKKANVGEAKPTGPIEDVTEPGRTPTIGGLHPITQTIRELEDLFGRMGYEVVFGPEIEDEFHNFDALNIPASHVARAPDENFYLASRDENTAGGEAALMLRSQTSTVQIRTMESREPPIRVITCGRVYRPDTHDATHYSMFHQIELLAVDEGLTMVDLRSTIQQFVTGYLREEVPIRFVPSYFPFTEPSAEVYVQMDIGRGVEWIELGGCGMVDPNVFDAVNYDREKYTGFAFGFGLERLLMRKHGITDIRLLFENDVRFLSQFS